MFRRKLRCHHVGHLIGTTDSLKIIGTTPTGRATCNRLDLNDEFHNRGFIQDSRQFWVQYRIDGMRESAIRD